MANEGDLTATVKEVGFDAQVITEPVDEARKENRPQFALPRFYVDALAQAEKEQKPIVLAFTADWCLPCQRMEKETSSDSDVVTLLERCIVLKVDPDAHASLVEQFGVVGLPDIRLITRRRGESVQLLDFQPAEKFRTVLSEVLADEPDAD